MRGAVQTRKRASAAPMPPVLAPDHSKALAQAVANTSVDAARTVAWRVAQGWWNALVGKLNPVAPARYNGAVVEHLPGIDTIAESFGAELSRQPVWQAAAEIGRLYCSLLPTKHRRLNGVFYTPMPLVSRLLDGAEAAGHDWTLGKVIDPSCGGGAFLIEAAGRMATALGAADPAIIVASVSARLRGWELDPFAAWLSHVCVEALLLPHVLASGKRLTPLTETRDSLTGWDWDEGEYALVMGNPAFGKIKDNDAIRNRFRRSLFGHPNLYTLFTDLAVHLAAPKDGIIAYLTPTSYLGGQYFKALRRLLAKQAPPFSIDIVESRVDVFEDVLQEVALSVFLRGSEARTANCSVIHVGKKGLRIEAAGCFVLPRDPEVAWLMPRQAKDAVLVERMLSMSSRLADWGYSVSTGPLVWNRKKARLHNEPRKGSVPVVWAESVSIDGTFRLKNEKRSHAAFYAPSGPADSNLVRAPCVLIQRTTAKEQNRRLITAIMPISLVKANGAVAVENHLNMVIAAKSKPAVPMKVLAAFFASDTADRVIRCINASVALSASEIESMPLPAPNRIISAMTSRIPEQALRRLYGIDE